MNDDIGKGKRNVWDRIGSIVEKRAAYIVIATIVITGLLVVPWLTMGTDTQADQNPEDEIFDLADKIDERMPSADTYSSFILEARGGDALTRDVLLELLENEEKLRSSEPGMKYLTSRYDVELDRWTTGIYTIADAVDHLLMPYGGLENANDQQVKLAIHYILQTPEGEGFEDSFSVKAYNETGSIMGQNVTIWYSPAIAMNVLSDTKGIDEEYRETLPKSAREGEDTLVLEYYNRELQDFLRGNQTNYKLWGIAIDLELEANDEAQFSVVLIFFAVILILVIVTLLFRSFSLFLLTAVGLLMVIIWMWGLSNLAGLDSSLTIDILIPVSILVLGVDYMIHAVHRYEEEKGKVREPRKAFGLSVAGVGGALFLAMITTVVAFGSNAISEIEEIVGFGVAASLAIVSAFWIMGFYVPSAKMLIDQFFSKKEMEKEKKQKNGKGSETLGKFVLFTARQRFFILPAVLVLSIVAGYLALQLEAKLDAKEYFDPESDFVVSLDKLDEHLADTAGEPVVFYIEGDLTDPAVWDAIEALERNFNDNENVAKESDTQEASIYADMFLRFERILGNNYTIGIIEEEEGVDITDTDGDSVPDTREQLRVVLHYMYENGVPMNSTTMMYDTAQVRELLWIDPENEGNYATYVMTGIPDTRELATVKASEKEFREDMKALDVDPIREKGLTGSAFERERGLTAITDSLSYSIVVAVILCFVVLIILFRSFKYALVTVIPEILVVVWLYAFMFLAGYHLNAVTATIAAISIGVGIDYSVHITARFRQEMTDCETRDEAMRMAAKHSGVALFGSAVSTMVGFAIIGFAPMPMFSSYGILTTLMIAMALLAALFVLPSLLFLVTRKDLSQGC
ncbi:MAG: MMPL family transporter [Thermoplasmatota archaeon]